MTTVRADEPVASSVRSGVGYWFHSFALMTRWELGSLRQYLPLIVAIQIVVGGGFAVGIGLLYQQIPSRNALFLATGVAVITLITVGLVLGPQLVANQKMAGTYDFMWSLPVPRTSQASAWIIVNGLIALPGMLAALFIASWRYGLAFQPSFAVVPAVLLTIVTATMIGYALGHAIRQPMITQLITLLLSFVILGFAPINFPPENLPGWLAELHQFLPFTHMAAVIRGGLTEGMVDDTPLSYVVLGLYTLVSVVVAAWIVGRRD